ncbi:MAG: arsenate reductase (azurin) small subunit [Nitrospirae bacterium]|nr:arsenate reductase (azurin) small subunit [Nitrospirota bacterium]
MKEGGLSKCNMTRRDILKTAACAGIAAAGAGMSSNTYAFSKIYPQIKVAGIKDMKAGRQIEFDYPVYGKKAVIIDMGCAVEGGIGQNKSIVAYSMSCTHLGCTVSFDAETGMLMCGCHQSLYDPKRSGKVLGGPAPSSLPMVTLNIDKKGDIYAIGVAGLLYGMRNNLLDAEEVK